MYIFLIRYKDLEAAFDDCDAAIRKFFNNDIVGALSILKPW